MMFPEYLPEGAFYVLTFSLAGLGLILVDIIDVKISDRPIGKLGYMPAGFDWLRNKIGYAVAEALNEPRFISRQEAINRIADSRWAGGRWNESLKPRNLYDSFLHGIGTTVDPAKREDQRKFRYWCSLALNKFAIENEASVRGEGDAAKYDEIALQGWLETQYDDDVIGKFGLI